MKNGKNYILGTLLSLPIIGILFYLMNPPQCPLNYTQEQVDASRCVVGANIGGMPIFLVAAIIAWFASAWLITKVRSKKET